MLYVYALLRPRDTATAAARVAALAPVAGLSPPVPVDLGAVAALASSPAGQAPDEILPTRRNMLAHARVLEACLPACPLLPMRFGTVAPSTAALAGAVAGRATPVLERLEAVEGRAEFGVRIRGDRGAAIAAIAAEDPALAARVRALSGAGESGHFARIELGRSVAERLAARRDRAQAKLLAALVPAAEAHLLLAPEEDTELLNAAFLLPFAEEARFEATLAEAAAAAADAFAPGSSPEIRLIGPAPVGRFVTIRLDLAGMADAVAG